MAELHELAKQQHKGFNGQMLWQAILASFPKLNPATLWRNPVMFVVEVGAALITLFIIRDLAIGQTASLALNVQIAVWLWITVLFANFAEAVAEGRGKAQADALRRTRSETIATKLVGDKKEQVPASSLRKGDVV